MRTSIATLCITALLVLAAEIVFPGCAVMNNGVSQDVQVRTKPASANVFVDGQLIGPAPITTRMSRLGFHKLRIEAPGFEPFEIPLVKKLWGYSFLNWFFPPGFVIDLATGAIFELDLPKNPPAGVSRGRGKKGTEETWASLVIIADLQPQNHGRQVGKMKRTPRIHPPAR